MSEEGSESGMQVAEARNLGRELARVYKRTVESFQQLSCLSPEEAIERVDELLSGVSVEDVLHLDPEEISWLDLDSLAGAGESIQIWEQIKAEARDELSVGGTVAKVVEGHNAKPWERAQFFALRQGMIDEWRPRGGMELALIDTLASSLYMYRFWLNQHVERATTRAEIQKNDLKVRGKRRPALSWEEENTARAAEMADRFHRMAMRSLRALRDLRRYAPTVSIQSAGQVNIGEKQVNLG